MILQAAETSPFVRLTEDQPWILWEKKTEVTALLPKEQTDARSVLEERQHMYSEIGPEPPVIPPVQPIQRKQYNAILSRIDQASRKTGSFSAWKS